MAVMPALGLMTWLVSQQREAATETMKANQLRLARLAATSHDRQVEATRQLLITLAKLHVVYSSDHKSCNLLFSSLLGEHVMYANIGLSDLRGRVVASGVPPDETVNIADRLYFREAVRTGRFSMGEYQVGRIHGRPSVNFGYPVKDGRGRLRGVIFASLDLMQFGRLAKEIRLPQGASLTVLDRKGSVLTRYPPEPRQAPHPVPANVVAKVLETGEGALEYKDYTGVSRVYAYQRMDRGATPAGYVLIGMEKGALFSEIDQTFIRGVVGLLVVAFLAIAAAVWIGQVLILTPLDFLAWAATRLKDGDLSARSGLERGDHELARLGRLFDGMAESLQRRHDETVRAHQALSQSELKFRSVVEQSADGIMLIDENGMVVEWNKGEEEITGLRREDVVGRPVWSVQRSLSLAVEGKHLAEDHLRHLAEAYPRAEDASWKDELLKEEILLADGTKKRLHSVVFPIKTEKGHMLGVISRDVTEQRRAEEALRESEERYRRLVESSPDAIAVVTTETIIFANAAMAKLLRMDSAERLIGRDPLEFVPEQGRAVFRARLERLISRQEKRPLSEAEFARQDGSLVDIELAAIPFTHQGLPALQVVARDISERRQVEQLKSDFVAAVSHELRSPLAVILGYSSLLERHATEKTRKAVKHISDRAHLMTKLVENLLEMSQIQTGEFSLRLQTTDLRKLVRRCAASTRLTDKHTIEVKAPKSFPSCTCDEERLEMALNNVVSNAVKFSPSGGKIEIRVRRKGERAIIEVRDEGIGIARQDQERIFDRFVQADMSSTRRYGGVGMGLYIARRVVEAHGGTVRVRSAADKGSVFTIDLPLTPGMRLTSPIIQSEPSRL